MQQKNTVPAAPADFTAETVTAVAAAAAATTGSSAITTPAAPQQRQHRRRQHKRHAHSARRRPLLRAFLKASEACVVAAALGIIISTFFVTVLQVRGSSMEPVLSPGELIISSHSSELQRGDLVAFYYNNRLLLKRVVAFAGETVDIHDDGTVYVNDEPLREDYLAEVSRGQTDVEMPYTVPENRFFMLGDKRSVSIDSRSSVVGAVPEEQIVGKLLVRVWPLNKITLLQ